VEEISNYTSETGNYADSDNYMLGLSPNADNDLASADKHQPQFGNHKRQQSVLDRVSAGSVPD
jgi:hypothetical protein